MCFRGFPFRGMHYVRLTHQPTAPYKQWQTLPSPDWVRANGAIVLEGYFPLCDDRVGSSSSGSDLGKNSSVICDMKWGLVSSSALCLPHLPLLPKQYHKQTVAIGKTAPSILPLRVPPLSTSSPCNPLKWKVPASIQDPRQDALEPFILNIQISSSSRIPPIPRFYHLLQSLPPSLLSNLFSPLQPCCLLKVQTHSPSPGLFHGLLLLFSTPATTLMLPWRWVMWSSHLFSGNPLNVALQPSEWRICFLVCNTGSITTRPLPTSPSFYAPSHQVQLLVVPGLCQVVSYLFTFAPRSPPPGMLCLYLSSQQTPP